MANPLTQSDCRPVGLDQLIFFISGHFIRGHGPVPFRRNCESRGFVNFVGRPGKAVLHSVLRINV
jgi:hypothetical protein